MADTIAKNDFVELRFTGSIKGGEVFDTNIADKAKEMGIEMEGKPTIICVGQAMILPKIDTFLIGKEIGKVYSLDVSPSEGFGERRRELLRVLPMELFIKQNIRPVVGSVFSFDNMPARISAVSGGRVTVDFNTPLAGKDLVYELNAVKKVDELSEKVRSMIIFYFRQDVKFSISGKTIILEIDPKIKPFLEAFSSKFKEVLGMDLEVAEVKDSPAVSKEESPAN
jgi:peptidylprolyl isomerase